MAEDKKASNNTWESYTHISKPQSLKMEMTSEVMLTWDLSSIYQ